jgi:DNA-binding transcriptional ArsR family regulator
LLEIGSFCDIDRVADTDCDHSYLHHLNLAPDQYKTFPPPSKCSASTRDYTVIMSRDFADAAALFSDPGRSAMLIALMDGRALPAGQLAMIANVAPQTASSHLTKLLDGQLLAVEQQGRHRYYRLASSDVAHAIEALLAITPRANDTAARRSAGRRTPDDTLAYARTCYSHLAGRLAVDIAEALQVCGLLVKRQHRFVVTQRGREWFAQLGIELTEQQMREPRFARCCLDWTERRHHIAGHLGAAVLVRFRELKWIAPMHNSRAVRVTLEGEQKLWELLRVNGRDRTLG